MNRLRGATIVQIQNNEKTDKSVRLLNIWQKYEIGTAVFCVISLVISTFDYEVNYSPYRTYHKCEDSHLEDTNMRWYVFGCTIAAMVLSILSSYSLYQWEQYLYLTDPSCDYIKTYKFYLKPSLEVLILAVFPYPSLYFKIYQPYGVNENYDDICFNFNEIAYSFMWLRLYFILKIVLDLSPYVGHVARRATLENRVKYGIVFAFKCAFKSHPLMMIIFFIGLPSIIASGIMMRIYERPLEDISNLDWENPIFSIWFCYSSMMLGVYGDYYPLTYLGRTVDIAIYIIGILFFALIFVSMENLIYLSTKQRKAFNDISLMNEASDVIKYSLIYYSARRGEGLARTRALRQLRVKLFKFSYKRKYILDMPRHRDLDLLILMRKIRKSRRNIDRIYLKLTQLANLINKKRYLDYFFGIWLVFWQFLIEKSS